MRNALQLRCKDCGAKFFAAHKTAKYCLDCRGSRQAGKHTNCREWFAGCGLPSPAEIAAETKRIREKGLASRKVPTSDHQRDMFIGRRIQFGRQGGFLV